MCSNSRKRKRPTPAKPPTQATLPRRVTQLTAPCREAAGQQQSRIRFRMEQRASRLCTNWQRGRRCVMRLAGVDEIGTGGRVVIAALKAAPNSGLRRARLRRPRPAPAPARWPLAAVHQWRLLTPVFIARSRVPAPAVYVLVSRHVPAESACSLIQEIGRLRPWPCLVPKKFCKIFQISRHIESLHVCLEY